MTFEQAEIAADAFRGQGASARDALGSGHLDHMAGAAAEYRQAKHELLGLRAAQGSEDAVVGATSRLANARRAVKRAINV